MGVFKDWLSRMFSDDSKISEWDFFLKDLEDTHLRTMALDTVINYICNRSSTVKFNTTDNVLKRKLNIRPNKNENAIEFRNRLLKDLIKKGECLAFKINNEFFIADSWETEENLIHGNTYKNITAKGLNVKMIFHADDVFYFKYHNERLEEYLRKLNKSYDSLFSRLQHVQMVQNQIRFYAEFGTSAAKSEDGQAKFKRFLEKFKEAVEKNQIVVMPTQKDFEVKESSSNYLGRSVEELERLEKIYLKDVAQFFSINSALFDGSLADISEHRKDFYTMIKGLFSIITTEINAKYKGVEDLKANIFDLVYSTELESSKDMEKLLGTGIYTIDDLLEIANRNRQYTKETTKRYLTKNFGDLKGGEGTEN